jgi:hypothetical protein
MSSQIQEVKRLCLQNGVPLVGDVVFDVENGTLLAYVAVKKDLDGRQIPSNRKIEEVKKSLLDAGVLVDFLVHDELGQDIESGLRATLLMSFPNEVRNAFLSISGGAAQVWIDPKRTFDEELLKAVERRVRQYLKVFNVDLDSLVRTTTENLPGVTACLSLIRHLAPVLSSELERALTSHGFTVPSEDWLKRRLDSMRKEGRIVRMANGTYALTLLSLQRLGTAKGKRSPDVNRMLALARFCR